MNILFVYSSEISPEDGGVQRVTSFLGDYFEMKNNTVFYLSLHKKESQIKRNPKQYFLPFVENLYHKENISFYINFVKSNEIDIILNQAALGGNMVRFCAYAKSTSNAKIISVIHNSLLGNVINFTSSHSKQLKKIPIPFLIKLLETKLFKAILKFAYILKYKSAYTSTCENSDKVVLLSKGFYNELRSFVPSFDDNKICAIPNPCTLVSSISASEKLNEILYVGRINTSQKKVDLLLKIWKEVYEKHPDWNLSIVGDGEERLVLEKQASNLGLERIKFCGLQDPISYYERSKILCMSSAYEGFPLVLAEAQVFGTIPIAFDSFASVRDIIDEGKNGFLIEPFDINKYSQCLSDLITNEDMMYEMSLNCQKSALNFSIEIVGENWLELFNILNNKSVKAIN
jgi:glycosyltransferase involved in cell wall biosynthesis